MTRYPLCIIVGNSKGTSQVALVELLDGVAAVWMRPIRRRLAEGFRPGGRRYELFDIGCDPGEKCNLAEQHPEIVRELCEKLEAWILGDNKNAP